MYWITILILFQFWIRISKSIQFIRIPNTFSTKILKICISNKKAFFTRPYNDTWLKAFQNRTRYWVYDPRWTYIVYNMFSTCQKIVSNTTYEQRIAKWLIFLSMLSVRTMNKMPPKIRSDCAWKKMTVRTSIHHLLSTMECYQRFPFLYSISSRDPWPYNAKE